MNTVKQIVTNLIKEESGQDLIEYALVTGNLGLGSVAAMQSLATKVSTAFSSIGTTLTSNV